MGSPSRSINKRRVLSVGDIATLAEAWLRFAWVDLNIRLRGYPHWRHWLQRDRRANARPSDDDPTHIIRLTEIAARRHWAPMNCLRRSVVQKQLLARRGLDAEVMIGVRATVGGALEAHAWLVCGGEVVNDSQPNVDTYQVLGPAGLENLPRFNG